LGVPDIPFFGGSRLHWIVLKCAWIQSVDFAQHGFHLDQMIRFVHENGFLEFSAQPIAALGEDKS